VVFNKAGVESLRLAYQGSQGFLTAAQRGEVVEWIKEKTNLTLEELMSHLKEVYQVVYRSKQSLYELLAEGEMSWHKSEKVNPKPDEAQVLERREMLKKSYWKPKPQ
jgi:putative transposase